MTLMPGAASLPAVGIDLVRVEDVELALAAHGQRYLQRLYTPAEQAYALASAADCSRRLAARFAAKEAVLKLLRPVARWLDWRLIEVTRNPHGHCGIALHGEAGRLAREAGLGELAVSLSHDGDRAVAVVMGLRGPAQPPASAAIASPL